MYHGNHALSKSWSFNTGFQERNYQTFQNYNLFLAYVGVNYKINNKWIANFTYGYIDIDRTFDPDVTPNTIEHRFFEQLLNKVEYFKIPFTHRFRLEHRNLYSQNSYKLINRIRYRFQSKIPITHKFYGNISNEFFFQFNGNIYPENRFYSALGFYLNKTIAFELGFLRQHINNQNLNRLQITVLLKTNHFKHKK